MSADDLLEGHFAPFRANIIGHELSFLSPVGEKEILYADWTASGRGYQPIESFLQQHVIPFFANSHTGTTTTGNRMTKAYEEAKSIIKEHVGANDDDVLVFCGSGMTAAVNKLQRLLGLRMPERIVDYGYPMRQINEESRPVVFVTSWEHHSNHISWLETIATVEIINQKNDGYVDLEHFKVLLEKFKARKHKIAAITACSNVTGIQTPYHEIAKLIHAAGGSCFVDFASSAPYVSINMHPGEEGTHLDAIYFSMHKFLGGPGTPGVLIFNRKIYCNTVPDHPGGGTILYSNPWKERRYVADVELREDGGTPPLLQGIKAAMCIQLKEQMGIKNIVRREKQLVHAVLRRMASINNLTILQGNVTDRLGIISFTVKGAHYNLIVRLLNDHFGIQARGGCSCAGTYGHVLLRVHKKRSREILDSLLTGDLSRKPGWIRISLHPTMTNKEVDFIVDAVAKTVSCFRKWATRYRYDPKSNEYIIDGKQPGSHDYIKDWFEPDNWK